MGAMEFPIEIVYNNRANCITFFYQLTDTVVITLLKAIAEAMSDNRES